MIKFSRMTAAIVVAILPGAPALVAQTTPPPVTPPVAPPASAPMATAPTAAVDQQTTPAAPAAPANAFDTLLTSAKPLASDPKTPEYKVVTAVTKDCVTQLSLEGGSKLSIDLKVMQGLAVNTNLMIRGGGKSVQLEFDGKNGSKSASDAEKALGDLNDKCG